MPVGDRVGDAVQTRGEMTFEWKISDFFSLSDKVDSFYHSPVFSFAEARWCLRLYPNGATKRSSEGWVGLFLVREDLGPPTTIHLTFGMKGSDGVERVKEQEAEFLAKGPRWGFAKLWSRSKLWDRKSTLVPNNVLHVTCDLRSDAICTVKGENKLIKSLLSMLECGEDSDVVIKVQGKELSAHRNILRARSSVFRSMFTHDMVEKQSNVVTIEDCDPETFQDFLIHIYSGSCDQISTENVYSLYTAADKYDVGELKEACSNFMKRNITVACFCDVITLALRHDNNELTERATKFFCDNMVAIVKTAEWINFLKDNLIAGNELIIKAVSK